MDRYPPMAGVDSYIERRKLDMKDSILSNERRIRQRLAPG
jgi:hypothetical protein